MQTSTTRIIIQFGVFMKLLFKIVISILILCTFSCVGIFYVSLGTIDSKLISEETRSYTWYSEGFSYKTKTGTMLEFKEDGTYIQTTYGGYVNIEKHNEYVEGQKEGKTFTDEEIHTAEEYFYGEEIGKWSTNNQYTRIRLSLSGSYNYTISVDRDLSSTSIEIVLRMGNTNYYTIFESIDD